MIRRNFMKKLVAVCALSILTMSTVPSNNVVTAAQTNVSSVSKKAQMKETTISLQVGEFQTLKLTKLPEGAKVTWSSTDPKIVKVNAQGKITALGGGTVDIKCKVKPLEGKSYTLSCKVKSSTTMLVDSQVKLEKALKTAGIKKITLSTSKMRKFTIPEGDYSAIVLEVNADKSNVINYGTFKSIIVCSIGTDSYNEMASGNQIDIKSDNETIDLVVCGKAKKINVVQAKQLNLAVEDFIENITVLKSADIKLNGTGKVDQITVKNTAEGTSITTSIPTKITSESNISVLLESGAEETEVKAAKADADIKIEQVKQENNTSKEDESSVEEEIEGNPGAVPGGSAPGGSTDSNPGGSAPGGSTDSNPGTVPGDSGNTGNSGGNTSGDTPGTEQKPGSCVGEDHDYCSIEEGDVYLAATCTTKGSVTVFCKRCGKTKRVSNALPALGHNHIFEYNIEPTCVMEGYDLLKCDRCSNRIKENTVAALEHNWEKNWIGQDKRYDCVKGGTYNFECTRCHSSKSGSYKEEPIGEHDHQRIKVEQASDCGSPSKYYFECTVCKDSRIVTYQDIEHTYGEAVVIPPEKSTQKNTGYTQKECTSCGAVSKYDYTSWVFTKENVEADIVKFMNEVCPEGTKVGICDVFRGKLLGYLGLYSYLSYTEVDYKNPKPGDVVRWTYTSGAPGHVAVIMAVEGETIILAESNLNWDECAHYGRRISKSIINTSYAVSDGICIVSLDSAYK